MRLQGPIGVALAGGGAHGAWQAGALRALIAGGLRFDHVLGFSAGSLTAAAYALGLEDELEERWKRVDEDRLLRFAPRLRPTISLFSGEPVWEAVRHASDEAEARRRLRCALTVVSLRVPEREREYSRFVPGAAGPWDGPLAAKLVGSCAIPGIFPPVDVDSGGRSVRLVDGGVPGKEWLRLDALRDCRTVLVLQMSRPDEIGRFRLLPWERADQAAREICHRHMNNGIASLLTRGNGPTVYRLYPSRRLDFSMLAFRSANCAPAFDQGGRDGAAFLDGTDAFAVRELSELRPAQEWDLSGLSPLGAS